MLARPSVTPKDRSDYIAAYAKRHEQTATLPADQCRTTVRFNPEISHISREPKGAGSDVDDGCGHDLMPIKGRKQTGFFSITQNAGVDGFPGVAQAPRHHDRTSEEEDGIEESADASVAAKPHKGGLSMGMASKIAGAMRKTKPKREASSREAEQLETLGVGDLSIANASQGQGNINNSILNTTCMTDAFAPIFAEGISLFSPKAAYNAKSNKDLHKILRSLPNGKDAFAAVVDSARHRTDKEERKEPGNASDIAPGPRARLAELAKAAKLKAQYTKSGLEGHDRARKNRDEEPGWSCAGPNLAPPFDSMGALPRLAVEPATPQTLHPREHGAAHCFDTSGNSKKHVLRNRLAECEQSNTADEVVWIAREGGEEAAAEERRHHRHHTHSHRHREERSHSRSRSQHHHQALEGHVHHGEDTVHDMEVHRRCEEHELRRVHRSHHPERIASNSGVSHHHHHHQHHLTQRQATHQSAAGKAPDPLLPDKRRGKVIDSGAETQRLNLAITMARTRMEMEIAEQQEVQENTKLNRSKGHFLQDDEEREKAWLEEAYEEAIKKELECQYLYDAHTLGGTW